MGLRNSKQDCVYTPLWTVVKRFEPGQELRTGLLDLVRSSGWRGAFVVSCVGSLTRATLRLANSSTIQAFQGPFEIVSLVGTLSGGEGGHLHICLSDSEGHVIGGHVIGDLIIYTTAEVVIGECVNAIFEREVDPKTGYDELVLQQRPSPEETATYTALVALGVVALAAIVVSRQSQ